MATTAAANSSSASATAATKVAVAAATAAAAAAASATKTSSASSSAAIPVSPTSPTAVKVTAGPHSGYNAGVAMGYSRSSLPRMAIRSSSVHSPASPPTSPTAVVPPIPMRRSRTMSMLVRGDSAAPLPPSGEMPGTRHRTMSLYLAHPDNVIHEHDW